MVVHAYAIEAFRRQPRAVKAAAAREEGFASFWNRLMWKASSMGGGMLHPSIQAGLPRELRGGACIICFRDEKARNEFREWAESDSGCEWPVKAHWLSIELSGEDPKAFLDCVDPRKEAETL